MSPWLVPSISFHYFQTRKKTHGSHKMNSFVVRPCTNRDMTNHLSESTFDQLNNITLWRLRNRYWIESQIFLIYELWINSALLSYLVSNWHFFLRGHAIDNFNRVYIPYFITRVYKRSSIVVDRVQSKFLISNPSIKIDFSLDLL